ncbi:MAG: hypothetical protein ACOX2W_09530, partial [Desulfomonilia bacterium]
INAFNQENIWDSFSKLWKDEAMHEQAIGKSLIYRFSLLEDGFLAVLEGPQEEFISRGSKLVRFQAQRTLQINAEKESERLDRVSNRLAGLIFEQRPEKSPRFKPERLIVSEYLRTREHNR